MILIALLAALASAQAPGPTRARANVASYISDADYPSEALRNREQGTVGYHLLVSPEGLRFTPARNAAGEPESDRVAGQVHWILSR